MGSYGDDRMGGDRWRDRHQSNDRDRDTGRGDYRDQGGRGAYGQGYGGGRGGDDRGFLDRAGDEVRSWFGDDDAQRRREKDERRWAREHHMSGRRDNDFGRGDRSGRGPGSFGPGSFGAGGFGTGWGNQHGESWNRDRPGERGWFDEPRGSDRGDRYGAGGFGSDSVGGGGARYGSGSAGGRAPGGDIHDPHYSEWRRRQIDDLDRDYDEYRREHQSKFEQEFGSWRSKRQGQRQALGKASEHMDVVGSDGSHVGTVDKVRGDRIILTRTDPDAGGIHHSIPCSWVESVDDKVMLNRTAEDAKQAWRSEERSQALFERQGERDEGPRNLNRSFSGTYDERGDRND